MSDYKAKVLIVDDDPGLLRLLSMRLSAAGYEPAVADSGERALGLFAGVKPDLVITDLRMGGMDGMALYDHLHARSPALPVIVLTAHGTIPDAVDAAQRGVHSYVTKPFEGKELLERIEQALQIHGASRNSTDPDAEDDWRGEIVSRSQAMEEALEHARRAAASEAGILIQSESGTGKELLARAMHRASNRRDGPFVPVNCNAIPEPLFESEFFGHVKGSFSGAINNHDGLLCVADGGTLFLDEVGDMPLPFQAKLLRALQEMEIRPVGATSPRAVDVRVISATHRDLEKAIEEGTFREDLYYRLNVLLLELPPLRERPEDTPLLATHFLHQIAERGDQRPKSFAPDAMEALVSAPWPGNVRQLRNVVEQTFVLSPGPVIPATQVLKALRDKQRELLSLNEAREHFERDYLTRLLQMTEGNVTQAARLARRNRTEFYKLLGRYHLDPRLFRPRASQ